MTTPALQAPARTAALIAFRAAYGEDTEERELGVGVELVRDEQGDFVVGITAFVTEKKR